MDEVTSPKTMTGVFSVYNPPLTDAVIPVRSDMTLRELSDIIRTGENGLSGCTSWARTMRKCGSDEYKKEKNTKFPSVTFGGVFDYRSGDEVKLANKGKKGLLSTSGLVTVDIDHISDTGLSLTALRDRLAKDSELGVRLIFVSPSGDGLKVICETSETITDQKSYKSVFGSLKWLITEKYGDIVDRSGSDITRLCLYCYDPDVILKDDGQYFDPKLHPVPEPERKVASTPSVSTFDSDDDGVEEIVRRVEQSGKDIAPGYEDYLPLAYSFSALGERGRELFHRVCSPCPKYKRSDADKLFSDCLKRPGFKEIGYFINLAKSHGINVNDYHNRRRGLRFTIPSPRGRETGIIRPFTPDIKGVVDNGGMVPKAADESPETKYSPYCDIPNLGDVMKRKGVRIPTSYYFEKSGRNGHKREVFSIPTGALTFISAKSSHGKSKMLQNLTLQMVDYKPEMEDDGTVLYFTYEEDLSDVVCQFANVYCNVHQMSAYGTPNTDVIWDYFSTGNLNKCPKDKKGDVKGKLMDFQNLYYSGRLRIFYTEFTSEDLCGLIKYLSTKMKIKAVFVDYVQLMHKASSHSEKRLELAEICDDLRVTAIGLRIPIVLAAQLNRQANNPSDMSEDNIAESADITRYANTILSMWNSSFTNVNKEYKDSQEKSRLEGRGFILGEDGKIYAKITKNRGATPYIDAILDFDGETGRISQIGKCSGENSNTPPIIAEKIGQSALVFD